MCMCLWVYCMCVTLCVRVAMVAYFVIIGDCMPQASRDKYHSHTHSTQAQNSIELFHHM